MPVVNRQTPAARSTTAAATARLALPATADLKTPAIRTLVEALTRSPRPLTTAEARQAIAAVGPRMTEQGRAELGALLYAAVPAGGQPVSSDAARAFGSLVAASRMRENYLVPVKDPALAELLNGTQDKKGLLFGDKGVTMAGAKAILDVFASHPGARADLPVLLATLPFLGYRCDNAGNDPLKLLAGLPQKPTLTPGTTPGKPPLPGPAQGDSGVLQARLDAMLPRLTSSSGNRALSDADLDALAGASFHGPLSTLDRRALTSIWNTAARTNTPAARAEAAAAMTVILMGQGKPGSATDLYGGTPVKLATTPADPYGYNDVAITAPNGQVTSMRDELIKAGNEVYFLEDLVNHPGRVGTPMHQLQDQLRDARDREARLKAEMAALGGGRHWNR